MDVELVELPVVPWAAVSLTQFPQSVRAGSSDVVKSNLSGRQDLDMPNKDRILKLTSLLPACSYATALTWGTTELTVLPCNMTFADL